ncbi:MAG TPA: hypothetical protein VIM02_14920 [Rhizomicrobium sp.]
MSWFKRSLPCRMVSDVDGAKMQECDCVTILRDIEQEKTWDNDLGTGIDAGTIGTIVSVNSPNNMTVEVCRGLASALVDVDASLVRLQSRAKESPADA